MIWTGAATFWTLFAVPLSLGAIRLGLDRTHQSQLNQRAPYVAELCATWASYPDRDSAETPCAKSAALWSWH